MTILHIKLINIWSYRQDGSKLWLITVISLMRYIVNKANQVAGKALMTVHYAVLGLIVIFYDRKYTNTRW